mmetsp:Transcript_10000/g.33343  ORF Transcript_10000/g.33343 Transcript_10000/m.33343 type:complete len:145 (-) Transcript_10000:86-520(-)
MFIQSHRQSHGLSKHIMMYMTSTLRKDVKGYTLLSWNLLIISAVSIVKDQNQFGFVPREQMFKRFHVWQFHWILGASTKIGLTSSFVCSAPTWGYRRKLCRALPFLHRYPLLNQPDTVPQTEELLPLDRRQSRKLIIVQGKAYM